MTPEHMTQLVCQTLYTALQLSAPFLLLAMGVGLAIALLQSLTQVQEMTLALIPKMCVVGIALTLLFPWMLKMMIKFTNHILVHGWDKIAHMTHYVLQ